MLTRVARATLVACLLLGLPALAPPARGAAPEPEPVPPKAREAVDRGLAWLKENQKADGSWATLPSSTASVPSLAAIAFLSRGHAPGKGPYGETVSKAIDYVLAVQRPDGLISRPAKGNAMMYDHGIATLMLAQARGSADDARKQKIDAALAKSVALILAAQKVRKDALHAGGWRYTPEARDSDLSVTGWQLAALRGAAACGVEVPKEQLDAGHGYVRRCAVRGEGGGFTYMAFQRDPGPARTGIGVVCLETLGDPGSRESAAGAEYLLAHPVTDPGAAFYYYTVYHVSHALDRLGGDPWAKAYPPLRDALLAAQSENGAWEQSAGQEKQAGSAYCTSMAVIALCVPYRNCRCKSGPDP